MLVKTFGAAVQGINATIVTIEVNVSKGIKYFLVGLPDNAVKESHERIVSALQYNGYKFPRQQIIINMAPADLRKEGSSYDLPLAMGIMAAGEQISEERIKEYVEIGAETFIFSGYPHLEESIRFAELVFPLLKKESIFENDQLVSGGGFEVGQAFVKAGIKRD